MGPTSAGKSAIAEKFVELLRRDDVPILHYDGDEVRDFFGTDFPFDEGSRGRVVETLAHLAAKANAAGVDAVVSALTAHQSARDYIRERIPNLRIAYVDCPIDVCAERDPKGLYEKAWKGEIDTLIGYNSEYVPPFDPDITLYSNRASIEENARRLVEFRNSLK
jgi:adenylylsulfate kinase